MKVRFSPARFFGFAAAFGLACAMLLFAAQSAPAQNPAPLASDIIILQAASPDEKSTLPPVPFPHDAHAKALQNQGKDCVSCHQPLVPEDRDHFSPSFKNTATAKGEERKNRFHESCIGCHSAEAKGDRAAGPQAAQCRSCHQDPAAAPRRSAPAFDASLHYRHIRSSTIKAPEVSGDASGPAQANCGACHHPTGSPQGKAPQVDSCRSCHGKGTEKEGAPFGKIAHESCISCHLSTARAQKASGPVSCSGCHDAATWARYAKVSPVPRLAVGQPDMVRMKSPDVPEAGVKPQAAPRSLPGVSFNHSLHENALPSCRSCHHDSLRACSSCHTSTGDAKGKQITIGQAMHAPNSTYSCVGCHEQRKTTLQQCAGCHIPKAVRAKQNCAFCHKTAAKGGPAAQSGTRAPARSAAETAPEVVRIGVLSQEFVPSQFPHGAIIRALEKGIRQAAPSLEATHEGGYTLCQSCHHNSPASAAPPKCANCHPKTLTAPAPDGRPALQFAYHQQCMTCHERMNIKKPANTDCAGCHAKRAPSP